MEENRKVIGKGKNGIKEKVEGIYYEESVNGLK